MSVVQINPLQSPFYTPAKPCIENSFVMKYREPLIYYGRLRKNKIAAKGLYEADDDPIVVEQFLKKFFLEEWNTISH